MGKLENNKQQKRTSLLDTAFKLFTTQGVSKTSIAEISQKAGIAKGTFYLYFKDKYDIRNKLVSHEASRCWRGWWSGHAKPGGWRRSGWRRTTSGSPRRRAAGGWP